MIHELKCKKKKNSVTLHGQIRKKKIAPGKF